ncbi:hypothetical protein N9P38_01480 [Flavobacteriales bacterium]|nr:hypothetical protein [Flavobacteriales bacterium]
MKTINRILLIGVLAVILLIIINVKSCSFFGNNGGSTIEIQKSEVNLGRLISGNKISIRDNIIVKQRGTLKVDGNNLGLGNENKEITLSFFSEIGYRPEDIIKSEKIDSVLNGEIISRTLLIELPLPDTLLYLPKNMSEKNNEWFWEGWYKDEINKAARKVFVSKLEAESYLSLRKEHITGNPNKTAMEATTTLFNYVNNAYKIGNDKGFDSIFATFSFVENGKKTQ